jgi:hypothetical protein
MSKNKFYNLLKNLFVEIETIKNENVGEWLEENIVHIQDNNELIYTHVGPSITIYVDSGLIEGFEYFGSESVCVSVNTEVFKKYFDIFRKIL